MRFDSVPVEVEGCRMSQRVYNQWEGNGNSRNLKWKMLQMSILGITPESKEI